MRVSFQCINSFNFVATYDVEEREFSHYNTRFKLTVDYYNIDQYSIQLFIILSCVVLPACSTTLLM